MSQVSKEERRVLVVEDERVLANILILKLEENNISCSVASDGLQALERIGRNSFDLIILDLLLPQVDGFEVLKHIREQQIETPVIVLSILSQDDDIRRAKELGANEYIVKSTSSLADIIRAVQKYLQ